MNSAINSNEYLLKDHEKICRHLIKKELIFKILVIGDFGVGKTSIIQRYAEGTFSSQYKVTIGADFAIKKLEWDDHTRITLNLWDIAGHERFGYLTGVYYRYAVAAAIVFDLTRPETFSSINKWLADLRKKLNTPPFHQFPIVLLANKGDVTTNTVPSEIVNFCAKNNILDWYITSAKENIRIDDAMIRLISAAMANHDSLQIGPPLDDEIVKVAEVPNKKSNCC